ncbi:RnfH family protein [Polaromonas sp. SM01]|uniref:RnfH family protein n=1 Tax=Polaromonas sp. SM01 TaxID=3085630 RepID=UPI002981A9D5|nr:RnfH family protein [Polaromonas sp. SM01]MDW5444370.1 RnfH family protein [Polaromonas sp. SM01]
MAKPETLLNILLVYSSAPRQVREWPLVLPSGSTVAQALEASGILAEFPELASSRLALGIWGRKTSLRQVLHAQDRLEIYRALRVDPKTARRERFSKQGVKKSGLFSQKRAGAKAGY